MSRGDVDNKVVRQQARKIRLISKGLVKGSRYGLSNFVLLNSAQTLVVTGHQCKIHPLSTQSEAIRKGLHLIPLQGLQGVLLDKYDGRINLDVHSIRLAETSSKLPFDDVIESEIIDEAYLPYSNQIRCLLNYERYRSILEALRKGWTEDSRLDITISDLNHEFLTSNDLDNPSAQTNDDGHAGATSSSAKPDNNVELASSRVHDKSKIALSEVERAGYQYGILQSLGYGYIKLLKYERRQRKFENGEVDELPDYNKSSSRDGHARRTRSSSRSRSLDRRRHRRQSRSHSRGRNRRSRSRDRSSSRSRSRGRHRGGGRRRDLDRTHDRRRSQSPSTSKPAEQREYITSFKVDEQPASHKSAHASRRPKDMQAMKRAHNLMMTLFFPALAPKENDEREAMTRRSAGLQRHVERVQEESKAVRPQKATKALVAVAAKSSGAKPKKRKLTILEKMKLRMQKKFNRQIDKDNSDRRTLLELKTREEKIIEEERRREKNIEQEVAHGATSDGEGSTRSPSPTPRSSPRRHRRSTSPEHRSYHRSRRRGDRHHRRDRSRSVSRHRRRSRRRRRSRSDSR